MRAAHIENGKVVNIIEVESLDFAGLNLVADVDLYNKRGNIGDTWANGRFSPASEDAEAAFAERLKACDAVVQGELDSVARSFGYGDPNRPDVSPILHAISYAEEPAVPKFQVEGRLLRAWRSLYWAACWPILDAVKKGQRSVPSHASLLAELNEAAPPPTPDDVVAALAAMV